MTGCSRHPAVSAGRRPVHLRAVLLDMCSVSWNPRKEMLAGQEGGEIICR